MTGPGRETGADGEFRWDNPALDWRRGQTVTAGLDLGAVACQAAVFVDGLPLCLANLPAKGNSQATARAVLELALAGTGLAADGPHATVATGFGREHADFADRAVTEIACHARGAIFMFGDTVGTVLDLGGQDCKAIHCDFSGQVTNFMMNDRCSAGAGRGMEVVASLLGVPVAEIGRLSLQVDEEPPRAASTCAVFAKSEADCLVREGWPKEKVAAAHCGAMAHCVSGLLSRIGLQGGLAITGGIAKNLGVVTRVEKELGVRALTTQWDPQLAGAAGAALLAQALLQRQRRKMN